MLDHSVNQSSFDSFAVLLQEWNYNWANQSFDLKTKLFCLATFKHKSKLSATYVYISDISLCALQPDSEVFTF